MSTAFLYPGQGSQKVGMGAELLQTEGDLLTDYVRQAEAASGQPIRKIMLEGPIEALTRTEVAQPALFCVSLAVSDAARARGLQPDYVAGHSLGEYTAAAASGAISVEDGIELVSLRGRLMGEIGDERPGAMAAVIGLDDAALEEVCADVADKGIVGPANYNSPGQTVISGELSALTAAIELAVERGARKVVRLAISIASHSPVMRSASDQFSQALARVGLSDAAVPVVANISARAITSAEDIRRELAEQITGSVRWSQSIKAMIEDGVQTIVEIGPGDALSGISRRISRDLPAFSINSVEAIGQLPSRLQELELRRVRGVGAG